MIWQEAQLKYVTRFEYGERLPSTHEERKGAIKVFGSNGPYAYFSRANTKAPAIIIGRKGSYGKINWSDEPVFASDTTFFVDRTTTKQHLRWLFYVLQTLKLDQGSNDAVIPGLNRDHAYRKKILVPSLPEQRAIANYLDRETAKLDELIAKMEQLIERLAEKRQALITHAVTRGLNPNVLMPDSRVEWLGEIPAHWEVIRIAFIADIDTAYYNELFAIDAFKAEVARSSTETVNNHIPLSLPKIRDIYVPVPPFNEQREIVSYIAHESSKLDDLHTATKCTIDLLHERGSALIAATVSGKIKVTK